MRILIGRAISLSAWFRFVALGLALTLGLTLIGSPTLHAQSGCALVRTDLALDSEEQTAMTVINGLRAARGVPALAYSPIMMPALVWKAEAMAAGAPINHDDPDRSTTQRFRDCGYAAGTLVGEAIATDFASGHEVIGYLLTSPAHLDILLVADGRTIGVARAQSPDGRWFWVIGISPVADDALTG